MKYNMSDEEQYRAYRQKMLEQIFGKEYFNSEEFGLILKEEYKLKQFGCEIDEAIDEFKEKNDN